MATARGARNAFVRGEEFLNLNEDRVNRLLDQGQNSASESLGTALGYYQPYADRFEGGSQLYSDALGVNGWAGGQRARDQFQAGPGYQWQMDQGMQALNRKRAAGGMLNSGNADIDAMNYGQGLANQSWNQWLGQLAGYDAKGLGTAGARAGIQGNLANMALQDAQQRGQLATDNTMAKIGLFSNAMQAGDAVRGQLTANRLAGVGAGLNILGSFAGMPGIGNTLGGGSTGSARPPSSGGGFTSLFG